MMNNSLRFTIVLGMLLVGYINSLKGQESQSRWATAISSDDLTASELLLLENTNHPTSGSALAFVRFSRIEELNATEMYTMRLTSSSQEYLLGVDYYGNSQDGHRRISGSLDGNNARFMIDPEGKISGQAKVENQILGIDPIGVGLSRIRYVAVDETYAGPSEVYDGYTEIENNNISDVDFCSGIVDVLYLCTSEVMAQFPHITSYNNAFLRTVPSWQKFVADEVDRTNETLMKSEIGAKSVRAIFHHSPVDVIDETHDPNATAEDQTIQLHSRLRSSSYIQQLRQQYDADVVQMYYYSMPAFGGLANDAFNFPAIYSTSYVSNSFVDAANAAVWPMQSAHELGHIFGGHHPYAHNLIDQNNQQPSGRRTAIRLPWADVYNTVKHYSNENVDFELNGLPTPTGTSAHNNAIRVSNNFCDVVEFEKAGGFVAQIIFPQAIPLCMNTINLCANAYSGNSDGPNSGPYDYEWRYSLHPSSATTVFSTSECVNFNRPFQSHNTYYLTLKITDQTTGQSSLVNSSIIFSSCPDSQALRLNPKDNIEQIINYEVIVDGQSQMFTTSIKATKYQLFSRNGQMLASGSVFPTTPIHIAETVPAGVYYVVLLNKNQSQTFPLWTVR